MSRGIALPYLRPRHLDGVGGQHHAPAALPPGKTWYPLYRRLGGPFRAGLDGCGKSRPASGIRSPDRPGRSESLYRLSYRGYIFLSANPSQSSSNLLVAYLYRKDELALPGYLHSSRISGSSFLNSNSSNSHYNTINPLSRLLFSSLLFFSLQTHNFYSPLPCLNITQ